MKCRVCESKTEKIFNSLVLHKYSVDYFHCPNCGFLQSENPYWLNEAYSRVINISDTGLIDRNIQFSKILSVLIYFNFNKEAKFLDYAGGYGIFTRLMRDVGFDFYWHDPYSQNLLANGFEFDFKSAEKFELITAFEVFEHLINPKEELVKLLELTDTIVFSTELLLSEIPGPKDWWYYGFEHGQHISFYSENTFHWIADYHKLKYYCDSSIHLLTRRSFNPTKMIILKKFRNYGLFQIVKMIMKSKTFSDHILLRDTKHK